MVQYHLEHCVGFKLQERTLGLQNSENFVTGDESHLGNTMRVTKNDANLGWCQAFSCEFYNVFDDIFGRSFKPMRGSTAVWEGRRG